MATDHSTHGSDPMNAIMAIANELALKHQETSILSVLTCPECLEAVRNGLKQYPASAHKVENIRCTLIEVLFVSSEQRYLSRETINVLREHAQACERHADILEHVERLEPKPE